MTSSAGVSSRQMLVRWMLSLSKDLSPNLVEAITYPFDGRGCLYETVRNFSFEIFLQFLSPIMSLTLFCIFSGLPTARILNDFVW